MLEFYKDGNPVKCNPIFKNGRVGQCVVLTNVGYSPDADLEVNPLAGYAQPAIFTIIGKTEHAYTLKDTNGKIFVVADRSFGASCAYLYDAQQWAQWCKAHEAEKLARKQNKIEQLEAQVDLLKSILIKQGIRVVTVEQADALGLSL